MNNAQARTFLQGVKSRKIRVTPDNSREFIEALDRACMVLAEADYAARTGIEEYGPVTWDKRAWTGYRLRLEAP